jgi:hypothetical protein
VDFRKLAERLLAGSGEFEDHAPAVAGIVGSADKSGQFTAFAQLDHGVVLEAQRLGYVRYRGEGSVWGSGYLQQELMLLRLQACCCCGLLAKPEKSSDFRPEFGEELNFVAFCHFDSVFHCIYIVTRYNKKRDWPVALSKLASPVEPGSVTLRSIDFDFASRGPK